MKFANNKFIVGAYVGSKSLKQWIPEEETRFYQELRNRPLIRGLEHPFYGKLHRYDDDWFLANINPNWENVITTIPGMMELVASDEKNGLASKDPDGRKRALDFMQAALEAIQKLNSHQKRKSVIAIQVHSAPSKWADPEAFALSLETMAAWDWEGTKILVEHCDRYKEGGDYIKGFLPLEQEIKAITNVQKMNLKTPVGAMLNWGRSVIEEKDTKHILTHIELLKSHGLLNGFIFSGTSATKESPYLFYGDKHAPPPTPYEGKTLVPESLMTVEEMGQSIQILPTLDYIGFKIMPLPLPLKAEESMIYIDYMLQYLSEAMGTTL